MYRLKIISQTEFYNEIFEDFICLDNIFKENELWKSNSIIKLMQLASEAEDKKIIEEGLKIILNLCKFKEGGRLLDSYEIESFSINQIPEPEKMIFETLLIAEFI